MRTLVFALIVLVSTACETGPSSRDYDADFQQRNVPEGVMLTVVPSVPEGTTVTVDFGDGTTFEGANPPPHLYAYDGVYTVQVQATSPDSSVSIPRNVIVLDTPLPDLRSLLDVGEGSGTELHAVNVQQVTSPNNFDRQYSPRARFFALRQGDAEPFVDLQADLRYDDPNAADGIAAERQVLTEQADGWWTARVDTRAHGRMPAWFEGDTPLHQPINVFGSTDRNRFDLDLPIYVSESTHPIDEDLTIRFLNLTNGGADLPRIGLHRGDDILWYEGTNVTIPAADLAGLGPGMVGVYGIIMGRIPDQGDPSVVLVSSWVHRIALRLTEP